VELRQEGKQVLATDDYLPSVSPSYTLDEGGRRTEYGYIRQTEAVLLLIDEAAHAFRLPLADSGITAGIDQTCDPAEWRVALLAAKGALLAVEGLVIVLRGRSDGVGVRGCSSG